MQSPGAALARIEQYYDLVPRVAAHVEEIGPFTLFVSTGPYPLYARPRAGALLSSVTPADVAAAVARQQELGVPVQFEWVDELVPQLAAAADAAGLSVSRYPLLMLAEPSAPPTPAGVTVRIASAEDPDIPLANAAIGTSFAHGGTAIGTVGLEERDAARPEGGHDSDVYTRERIAAGDMILAIAATEHGPVGGGSASPRGDVSELMGIATLPAFRRRGIGLTISAALTAELRRRGVDLAFLTAGSDDVARIYERAGYRRLATACIAVGSSDVTG